MYDLDAALALSPLRVAKSVQEDLLCSMRLTVTKDELLHADLYEEGIYECSLISEGRLVSHGVYLGYEECAEWLSERKIRTSALVWEPV